MFFMVSKGAQLLNLVSHKTNKTTQKTFSFKPIIQIIRKSCSTNESIENNNSLKKKISEQDFKDSLIKWAIQNNISHLSFSKLLKLLSEYGVENLPNSSKELLKAREDGIKSSVVPPGTYTHFGFKANLKCLLESLIMKNLFNKCEVGVSIFIDNLPLVKFTGQGLWVILGSVEGFTNNIFFIGAYHGYSRPKNVNLFLSEFVEEAKNLCTNGLKIHDKLYDVKIKRLICDAPAKSFVLNIKDFSGYSSCTKCNTVGEYKAKRICFLEKSTPRTNEDFERDDLYMTCKTNLLEIPNFGVVSNVTLDYMHLVCLGVLQKLLYIWLTDKKHWRDENLGFEMKNICSPCEFHTKPKSFHTFSRWSANEFRQFLLYLGPVVLKNTLKEEYYQHFLLLHISCRLLCIEATTENIDRGGKLLNDFIQNYKSLYKTEQITHNVHGLYHLADECAFHGTLDSFSAFPFEKFLLKLRNTMKKCRKRSTPKILLKESYDKIFTKSLSKLTSHDYKICKKIKNDDDVLTNYEKLSLKHFEIIPNTNSDKYVLLRNNKIIEVTKVLEKKDKSKKIHFIAGREFMSVRSFYPKPFDEFRLEMYNVGRISDAVEMWPVDLIDRKCMKVANAERESVMIGLLDENY